MSKSSGAEQELVNRVDTVVDDSTIAIATDTLKVKDGGIGATQLAAGAVTTVKIGDDQVTNAKIAAGAVGTTEIADSLGEIGVNSFTGSFSGSFSGDVDINLADLTAGDGLSGTAYDGNDARTFAVQSDVSSGGDIVPVSVAANGVGLDVSAIVGEGLSADGSGNLNVDYGILRPVIIRSKGEAREAFKLAAAKLPVRTTFIKKAL